MHCSLTPEMFDRRQSSLVNENFFELMSFYDCKFFRMNALWEHFIVDDGGANFSVKNIPCSTKTIRFSTPHDNDVTEDEMNVLTSKIVSYYLLLLSNLICRYASQ